ncbi:MAG: sensor histidine kinase [Myxococcota bacterium]
MAFAPGLRFQILLIVAGLAAASTALSVVVTLAAVDQADSFHREESARLLAAAVASTAAKRCPGGERSCIEDIVEEMDGGARLIERGGGEAPGSRLVPLADTGFSIALEPAGAVPRPARRLVLVFGALNVVVLLFMGGLALSRGVVRPVEALAGQVDRVGRLEFGETAGGHQLGRLGSSFRRMVAALADERERVQRQIEELEETNRSLEQARDAMVRSEKLAAVGRLSAGLAHEIGNPLGGLIGYLEILKTRVEDPSQRELLEGALSSCQRIDHAIRELLDLARPKEVTVAPFEVKAAMEEARRLVLPRVGEARIEMESGEEALVAVGDRGGLVQVLVNLLLNAVDATERSGTILLSARHEEDRIVVSVIDDGPGLPPGKQEEIFEPFFTTKAPGEGTGLGLAISRSIVESWGGRMWAADAKEGGAVLAITLPKTGAEG